jgi:hypothetical protein
MQSVDHSGLIAKAEVKRAVTEIQRVLRETVPVGSFGEREAAALAVTNEAVLGYLVGELQRMSEGFGEELLINGVAYRRHEPGTGLYHSLCGPVQVERYTYRQIGMRNGPTAVPLELAAGLVEGATPALACNVAHGYGQHDMRLHGETLLLAHRQPPARATLERIATDIAAAAVRAAPRIEPMLRRAEAVPEATVAIVMGLDRTAVPMVEDRPPDAPAKPEPKRRKPRVRQPPAPFDINWRMAYVGTVSYVDSYGEALQVRRYALPACDDPRPLVGQMTADLRTALKHNPALNAGIVQDGAREMWDRTREGMRTLRDEGLLDRWYEGLDRYHLLERLAGALQIVECDAAQRHRLLDQWREDFARRNSTVDEVERYFVDQYARLTDREQRERLWQQLVFLANHKSQMRYITLRNAGLPVGSGVTESSAKTVVGQRAKGSGQRWREQGLRGVLTLRALHQSERFPKFWARFARRYTARVLEAA